MNAYRPFPLVFKVLGFSALAFLVLGVLPAFLLPGGLPAGIWKNGAASLLAQRPGLAIFSQCVLLAVAFLALAFFRGVLDRDGAGLLPDGGRAALRQGLWGAGVGTAMVFLLLAASFALGAFRFRVNPQGWSALPLFAVFFLLAALKEEIFFRWYALKLMAEEMQPWKALAASVFLVSLFHRPGGGVSVLSVANLLLLGVLLGLVYLHFKSIWAAVGLHFAWGFLQALAFGVETGNGAAKGLLIPIHLGQPGWVSGGSVGIEGPILATLIFVGAIGWIFFSMKPALVKAEEVEAAA